MQLWIQIDEIRKMSKDIFSYIEGPRSESQSARRWRPSEVAPSDHYLTYLKRTSFS
ncbi:hypothetical protein C0J52_03269 [Blattella germanica]|nr:hypothetical protein C0J52_03269 [Blattella germanica]